MHKYFYSWKNLLADQVIEVLNSIGIFSHSSIQGCSHRVYYVLYAVYVYTLNIFLQNLSMLHIILKSYTKEKTKLI